MLQNGSIAGIGGGISVRPGSRSVGVGASFVAAGSDKSEGNSCDRYLKLAGLLPPNEKPQCGENDLPASTAGGHISRLQGSGSGGGGGGGAGSAPDGLGSGGGGGGGSVKGRSWRPVEALIRECESRGSGWMWKHTFLVSAEGRVCANCIIVCCSARFHAVWMEIYLLLARMLDNLSSY